MEERATVTALDGQHAWVQTVASSACGSCNVSGCGGAVLGSLAGAKVRRYRVCNDAGAAVGEPVMIGVPDGAVVRASLLGYLLPLLGMVGGAVAASSAGLSDLLVALVTVLGLGLTAGLARRVTARAVRRFQPYVIRSAAGAVRPVVLQTLRGNPS